MRDKVLGAAKQLERSLRQATGAPPRVTLVPPAADGSLGDQAMLDAASAGLARRGAAVSILNPYDHSPFPTVRTPVGGFRIGHPRPLARLANRLRRLRAEALGVIGADVIDGVYGADLLRLRLIGEAIALGDRAAVLGCSFSETPAPAVVERMRLMPELVILARDPVSQERLGRALGRDVPLVADLAFLMEPEARAEGARALCDWARRRRTEGLFVLIVNASAHTFPKMPFDAVAAYVGLLRAWLTADPARAALLVPHDVRPAPIGDVEAMTAIHDALSPEFGDRVALLRPPFDAWDVKALAAEADAALTGRMHLAIAALGTGAPPLCLVYQGKFEGLMRHFDLDGLLIDPAAFGDPASARAALDGMVARAPDLRRRIEARLPQVRALSKRNFDALL